MRGSPQTLRVQVVMAFLVCFCFIAVIIAVNHVNFRRLARTMQVAEVAEELNSTVLEMRRYEKTYFLYRQDFNYEANVKYTNHLHLLLKRENDALIESVGAENYELNLRQVESYGAWMETLPGVPANRMVAVSWRHGSAARDRPWRSSPTSS